MPKSGATLFFGGMLRHTSAILLICAIWWPAGGVIASSRADVSISADTWAGGTVIQISGEIRKGDAKDFIRSANDVASREKWANAAQKQVRLNSKGGDIFEALVIGREVRRRSMSTGVWRGDECDSACVFILIAGVLRVDGGKVGLHRPAFDPDFFVGLGESAARDRYNLLVGELKHYYIDEMGGTQEAFQMILSTPSTSIRYMTDLDELEKLGLIGSDPASDEFNEAQFIQQFGRERWLFIKACMKQPEDFPRCRTEAYRRYPN